MAVIEDIDMAIRVDGRDLREFFDQDSDHSEKSISKYIEAVSGAKFEIVTIVSRSHVFISDALGLEIFLDGELVQRPLITKADCNPTTNDYVSRHVRMIKGVSYIGGSGWEFRPFKFAEITFVEEESARAYVRPRLADLGIICVKIFNKKMICAGVGKLWDMGGLSSTDQVAEKEMKGRNITHSVELGNMESAPPPRVFKAEYHDGKDLPIATFTFKYCSRKALQGLQIIPRSPSPVRSSTPIPLEERPFETLTQEEKDEIVRRQQARYRAERAANIKREGHVKPDPAVKSEHGIKRERDEEVDELVASSSARKAKTRPFAKGEVVDLD